MDIWHAGDRGQRVQTIKLRWRMTYKVGGEMRQEMGDVPEFGLA